MDTNIIFENLEKYLNKRTFKKIGDDFYKGNDLSTDESLKYKFQDEEFLGYRKNDYDDEMLVLEFINKRLQKKILRFLSDEEFKLKGNRFIEKKEIHLFEEYNRIFDEVFNEIVKKIYRQFTTQNTAFGHKIFKDRLCDIIDEFIKKISTPDFEIPNEGGESVNVLKTFLEKYKIKIQSIGLDTSSEGNNKTNTEHLDIQANKQLETPTIKREVNPKQRGFFYDKSQESYSSLETISHNIWKYLKKQGIIAPNTKFTEFRKVLTYGIVKEKVVWLGDINQLHFFINELLKIGAYKNNRNRNKWITTVNCFCLDNQKKILVEQLQRTKKPKTDKIMEIKIAINYFTRFILLIFCTAFYN